MIPLPILQSRPFLDGRGASRAVGYIKDREGGVFCNYSRRYWDRRPNKHRKLLHIITIGGTFTRQSATGVEYDAMLAIRMRQPYGRTFIDGRRGLKTVRWVAYTELIWGDEMDNTMAEGGGAKHLNTTIFMREKDPKRYI